MTDDTVNEACQHRKSIKYGGRRRKCISCPATWTVRPRKRGPKASKRRLSRLQRTFVQRLTLVQQARRSSQSSDALSKSHAKSLERLIGRPWPHQVPEGDLILVIDAMWFRQSGKRTTVYLMGLRAMEGEDLIFLRPVLRPGHESQKRWREVLAEIPEDVRERICAFVSDSFAGSGGLAKSFGWVFQRCQAHLLGRLATLCGDNKRTVSWREGRQRVKDLMHALMDEADERKAGRIAAELFSLSCDRECPRRLRLIIRDTLRHLNEYRACFRHPDLRLPATTNALENTNSRARSLLNRSRGCRTSRSLLKWMTGFLWFCPTVKCRPKLPTEIRR